MEERKVEDGSENLHRFKWFSSLGRLRRESNKENSDSKKKSANVFYTIRRKLQKRFNSARKVIAAESTEHRCEQDVTRIVLESEIQNSTIHFSAPSNSADVVGVGIETENNLDDLMASVKKELNQFGWYWGNLSRTAAQKRLNGKPNGSFLVRDSQTEKYQFTLSFRSAGVTLHCRIYLEEEKYWSYIENARFSSVVELIQETMRKSESSVFGFVKQNSNLQPPFPVRLTNPINRFYEVASLQHLCRHLIRTTVPYEKLSMLTLPNQLKEYLQADYYDL